MKRKYLLIFICLFGILAYVYITYNNNDYGHKVVLCIPVYGQSLALGEEAIRITDFDSLQIKYDGKIVTENLDYVFGYYDHSSRFKQLIKRLFHYNKKAFELSVYGMAEYMAPRIGEDTLICIFPGGHGLNTITELMKPAQPYKKFIQEIAHACLESRNRGWDFCVPAVCWMQGESDIADYPNTDYKELFKKMYNNLNSDIKAITHQQDDIRIITYQTNAVSKGDRFQTNNYDAIEPLTPTSQMEMLRDDTLLWASGPVYPYTFVNEVIHIDAEGQKRIGSLAALSALGIIHHSERRIGLMPINMSIIGHDVRIEFNVPSPPLCFDTVLVNKIDNYGFNVIKKNNLDIVSSVDIDGNCILIKCNESPIGCKVRYAINGDKNKNGRINGPRGNLRDSQGNTMEVSINGNVFPLHNWCLQFDLSI